MAPDRHEIVGGMGCQGDGGAPVCRHSKKVSPIGKYDGSSIGRDGRISIPLGSHLPGDEAGKTENQETGY
jgi:hypothetical protein